MTDADLISRRPGLGLRAARDLQSLKGRTTKSPMALIPEFEQSARKELGIVEEQAWTMQDWVERQSWGKFKSLQRATHQDVAVYHYLRKGLVKPALAQLIQNMESNAQAAGDDADWVWHGTCVPSPTFFGGKSSSAARRRWRSLLATRRP